VINNNFIKSNENNDLQNCVHNLSGNLENTSGILLPIDGFEKLTVEKISKKFNKKVSAEQLYSTTLKTARVSFIPDKQLGNSSKVLSQIFANECDDIIFIDKKISCLKKDGVTDCVEFPSVYEKSGLEETFQSYDENRKKTIKAVTAIQKYFRGWFGRKPYLYNGLYAEYHLQCQKTRGPESRRIPRAEWGKTKVYLPEEMPAVVLKNSGEKEAVRRFHQMTEVRAILNSQKSSHLIIPKANVCEDFLVEERLRINVDSYYNMEVYLSHSELFNEAVSELTRLFSKIYIGDLVSYQNHPLGHIEGVEDFVRYDNLPLYVVEEKGKKKGKIGLIDLEDVKNEPNFKSVETLVRIFPLHLDVIKNEAIKFKIKFNQDLLLLSARKGKKYLQVGFADHLEWLKQKGVFGKNFRQPFEISSQRVKEVAALLQQKWLNINRGDNKLFRASGSLQKDAVIDLAQASKTKSIDDVDTGVAKLIESITELIISNLKTEIQTKENEKLPKLLGHISDKQSGNLPKMLPQIFLNDAEDIISIDKVSSGLRKDGMTDSIEFSSDSKKCGLDEEMKGWQLVSFRSPVMKRQKLYKGVVDLILENKKVELKENFNAEEEGIAMKLTYLLMQEFVRGGEIFYFDPGYYIGGCQVCWIRY
jgi:hypothetical protein